MSTTATTWPDGSPRDPRFRPSKTGTGWIFDSEEGPVQFATLEDARNQERYLLALEEAVATGKDVQFTIERTIETTPERAAERERRIQENREAKRAADPMGDDDQEPKVNPRRHYIDRDRKQGPFAPPEVTE